MIGCLSRQKSRDIFYMYLFLKNLVFVQSLRILAIPSAVATKLDEAEDQTHRYGADLLKRYSLTDLRVLPWSR